MELKVYRVYKNRHDLYDLEIIEITYLRKTNDFYYDNRNNITRLNKLSNTTLVQSSKMQNRSYDHNYSLGFDYRLNDKNTIVINTSASFGNTNTATQANSKASNADNILQNISQKNSVATYNLQFVYEKQFAKS